MSGHQVRVTATHTGHTVATFTYYPWLGWVCEPSRCDMSLRRSAVDGYKFAAPGEWASVHRESFHDALEVLLAEGETRISIKGVLYLRRLAENPVPGPKPISDEVGFPIAPERRHL